jgi:hypothetical protein
MFAGHGCEGRRLDGPRPDRNGRNAGGKDTRDAARRVGSESNLDLGISRVVVPEVVRSAADVVIDHGAELRAFGGGSQAQGYTQHGQKPQPHG